MPQHDEDYVRFAGPTPQEDEERDMAEDEEDDEFEDEDEDDVDNADELNEDEDVEE